jgi:predicted Fe-S protein YdhL (DUF1289 family)
VPLGIPHSEFLSWTEDDQDKALAYHREMARMCKGCGTRQEEWDDDPDAYIGDLQYCEGCARLADERNNLSEAGSAVNGLRPRLLPRRQALARAAEGKGVTS